MSVEIFWIDGTKVNLPPSPNSMLSRPEQPLNTFDPVIDSSLLPSANVIVSSLEQFRNASLFIVVTLAGMVISVIFELSNMQPHRDVIPSRRVADDIDSHTLKASLPISISPSSAVPENVSDVIPVRLNAYAPMVFTLFGITRSVLRFPSLLNALAPMVSRAPFSGRSNSLKLGYLLLSYSSPNA